MDDALKTKILAELSKRGGYDIKEVCGIDNEDHVGRYFFAAELLAQHPPGKVLDAASGHGYGTFILSHVAHEVVGIDLDTHRLSIAKKIFAAPNIQYFEMDATKSSFENAFDAIVSFETLEHLKNQEAFISALHRALKPGGVFIVSTPNRDAHELIGNVEDNPESESLHDHKKTLGQQEFIDLLSKFFVVEKLYGQGFLKKSELTPGMRFARFAKKIDVFNLRRMIRPEARNKLGLPQPGKLTERLYTANDLAPLDGTEDGVPFQMIAVCRKR